MNFNTHIYEICKKASQRVGIMTRLLKLTPTNVKVTLYKSTIPSYLTYCHLTWYFFSAGDKRKLEHIQERTVCVAFLDKQISYQALLDKSDLMMLQNRKLQETQTMPTKIWELFHTHCVSSQLISRHVSKVFFCMYPSSYFFKCVFPNCIFLSPWG